MKSCYQNCKTGDIICFLSESYKVMSEFRQSDQSILVKTVCNGVYRIFESQFCLHGGVQRVIKKSTKTNV